MIHSVPLIETADALRRDQIEIDEYLDELKNRVNSIEPELKSLVPEENRWERIKKSVTDLEARFSDIEDRPSLYGVPIGVKDIFHVNELPTRAGSDVPPRSLAGREATVVETLKKAGTIILGKTVTAEFAHSEPGPTRNPHDLAHTPGGSSSGSAAAVAAGHCPLAFGSQTIGSVTRPAAFCGIVGFKPSYDRISTQGVIPFAKSVDHVGFFTQDTTGAHLVAKLLCDEWRPLPEPHIRPVIGVPEGPYLQQADDFGRDAFKDHVARIESAGYDVKRVSAFKDIDQINKNHEKLIAAEFALVHQEWYTNHPEGYAEATIELLEEGRSVSTEELAVSRLSRKKVRERLESRMRTHGIDIWISPSAPGPAPEGIDTTGDPIMNLPWTHTGLPTVGLPVVKTNDELPVGVQCAAHFGADEDLLAWSHKIANVLQ